MYLKYRTLNVESKIFHPVTRQTCQSEATTKLQSPLVMEGTQFGKSRREPLPEGDGNSRETEFPLQGATPLGSRRDTYVYPRWTEAKTTTIQDEKTLWGGEKRCPNQGTEVYLSW